MKKHLIVGISSLLLASIGQSQADNSMEELLAMDLAQLLTISIVETDIATKTKMNADKTPGMVTVLSERDLAVSGARTVWEALEQAPGVAITYNNFGELLVQVRGVGYTQHAGVVKVLLNNLDMTSAVYGSAEPVMALPIEQVERIEVIRGPGAAVYGEFAYMGVINVITRQDINSVYLNRASHDTWGGGAVLTHEQGDLRLNANLAYWDTRGSGVDSGPDVHTDEGIGYAPGPIDDEEGARLAILAANYQNTELRLQLAERSTADFYGLVALPPPEGLARGTNRSWQINLNHQHRFSENLQGHLRTAYKGESVTGQLHFIGPAGAPLPGPQGPDPAVWTVDTVNQRHTSTTRWEVETELNWTGWKQQNWLLNLAYANLAMDNAWEYGNSSPNTPPNTLTTIGGTQAWIPLDKDREIVGLTLQDQLRLSDTFELTLGLRYDDYSDVGSHFSPRLAGVWRIKDRHILKAQYAEAFRPPTFVQLYDARVERDLEPETLESWEVGYVYRAERYVGRITVFHTQLKNMLVRRAGPPTLDAIQNSGEIALQGVEWEWEQNFSRDWKLLANLSYTDTEDKNANRAVGGSRAWLANLIVTGRLTSKWFATVHYRHNGDVARWASDERPDLAGYDTVDLSLNGYDLGVAGLTLRAGVKNLLNTEVKLLAMEGTYIEDLNRPSRTWWMGVEYAW